MSTQTAIAWKTAKPYRAPKPPAPKPVKRATIEDVYGRPYSYAASCGMSERAASFYDVLSACQEKANATGEPLDIVRVYVLRSKASCQSPTPRDWASCAERYMGLPVDDVRIYRDPRLPWGRAVTGVVHHYVATVYPEA